MNKYGVNIIIIEKILTEHNKENKINKKQKEDIDMKLSAHRLAEELGVSWSAIWNMIKKNEKELLEEGIIEVGGKKLQKRYKIDYDKFKEFIKRKYPDKYLIIYEA